VSGLISFQELDQNKFIRAMNKLRELFPKKPEGWFTKVKERFFNVEFIGKTKKGNRQYRVYKNPKLGDNYRQGYRVVTLGGFKWWFCTCYFAKYGEARRYKMDACTHIGASLLFELYHRC
jgi:hypothetical protein